MATNYTPRDFTFTVNGTDCTNTLVQVSGGYSQMNNSGLLLLQAQFQLLLTPEFPESFDDRINATWAIGNQIDYLVLSERFPLIGTTFIESSEWDRLQTLSIKAAGLLSIFNSLTPADLGVCVELDATMSHTVAVTTLLNKAGIPLDKIRIPYIPGFLKTPLVIQGGQSFISLAGQIAFSSGRFLYQDNTGLIRSITFVDTNHGLSFTDVELGMKRYTRLYEAQLPPKNVIVSGSTATLENNLDKLDKTYTSTREVDIAPRAGQFIFGGSLKEKTTTIVDYDEVARTVLKKTNVVAPKGAISPAFYPGQIGRFLSNRERVNEFYELITQPNPTPATANIGNVPNSVSVKTLEECVPNDPGRIYRRRTVNQAPRVVPLEDYMKIRERTEPDDGIIGSLAVGTWKTQEEEWTYNLNELPDESLENATFRWNDAYSGFVETFGSTPDTAGVVNMEEVTYTRHARVWIGNIFPNLAGFPWGKGDGGLPQPTQYVTLEKEITKWVKTNRNSDVWDKTRTVARNRFLDSPELINEMIADSGILATTVVSAVSTTRVIESSVETNAQPPNFGTFPSVTREKNDPYKIIVELDSPLVTGTYDKTLSLNLGSYPVDKTFAARLGGEWGRILWQRSKGQLITVAMEQVPSNVRPLLRTDIQEIDGSVASYGIDGPQVGVSRISENGPFEAAFSYTGLFQGKTTAPAALPVPVSTTIVESPIVTGADLVGPITITASVDDEWDLGISGVDIPLVLTAGVYADAAALITEINTQLAASTSEGAALIEAELSPSGDGISITTDLIGSTVTITSQGNTTLGFVGSASETGDNFGDPASEYTVEDPAPNPPAEPMLQFGTCIWNWYTALIVAGDDDIEPEQTDWTWSCDVIVDEYVEVLDICSDNPGTEDYPYVTELFPQDSAGENDRPIAGYTIP